MKTTAHTTTAGSAAIALGDASRRFRTAQAEFDRTRLMTTEYVEAQDAMRIAYDRWLAVRGY